MKWSKYNYLFFSSQVEAYLLYSALSNMLIELNENAYQEILKIKENPNQIDKNDVKYASLFKGQFIVDSDETEVNKIILTALSQRFDNTKLSLTLVPTRACNFNCTYCYESDRPNEKMSKKVQDGIIDFVKRQSTVQSVHVTWYGGEPTLAIPEICYLSQKLKQLMPNYSAFMVTNGYCLNKVIPLLQDLNITGLQITIDGNKESHNQKRFLRSSKGTFDRIIQNIEKLVQKHDKINVSIRMNIDKANAGQYIELHRFLQQTFDKKVNLYPAFIHDYTGSCKTDSCYDDSCAKAMFLKDLFYTNHLYSQEIYPFRGNKGCMMQQLNAFVIGTKGELYKCWHHLGYTEKVIGNIFDNQIFTNYDFLADCMLRYDMLFQSECTSCLLFPSCNGGCSDLRSKRENVCIPAKAALEDFLNIYYKIKTTVISSTN
jgi:uncharacterized protein